jgi:hypothetical protein
MMIATNPMSVRGIGGPRSSLVNCFFRARLSLASQNADDNRIKDRIAQCGCDAAVCVFWF